MIHDILHCIVHLIRKAYATKCRLHFNILFRPHIHPWIINTHFYTNEKLLSLKNWLLFIFFFLPWSRSLSGFVLEFLSKIILSDVLKINKPFNKDILPTKNAKYVVLPL